MGLALLLSICGVFLIFMLLYATSDIEPLDYFTGAAIGMIMTFFMLASYHFDSKERLEFVLDSKNKEIVLKDGKKLRIYFYDVSKSDSAKVKIKAGKEKKPDREKENEFTNFN